MNYKKKAMLWDNSVMKVEDYGFLFNIDDFLLKDEFNNFHHISKFYLPIFNKMVENTRDYCSGLNLNFPADKGYIKRKIRVDILDLILEDDFVSYNWVKWFKTYGTVIEIEVNCYDEGETLNFFPHLYRKITDQEIVKLKNFTLFTEYFISLSLIYLLIVIILITYGIYRLIVQKSLSNCIAIILLMSCYLLVNDALSYNYDSYSFLLVDDAYGNIWPENFLSFNKSINIDHFSFFTKFLVSFVSSIYFLIISNFLKDQKLTSFEFLIILLFAVLGLILLCTSYDFTICYLAIELSSLSFYILAAFKKNSIYSVNSGIKYFVIGSISSSFFLFGISFLYGVTGSLNLNDLNLFYLESHSKYHLTRSIMMEHNLSWYNIALLGKRFVDSIHYYSDDPLSTICMRYEFYTYLSEIINHFIELGLFYFELLNIAFKNIPYLDLINSIFDETSYMFHKKLVVIELGITLILISLSIKLSLAPFHLWSLDVYEGSPTITTFFFIVVCKISIFVFLARLFYCTFYPFIFFWYYYPLLVGLFSIFIGSFGGLKQRKLKTLLAYSSISHMGYLMLSFGTGNLLGLNMLFFYLIIYIIAGLSNWLIVLLLKINNKSLKNKYSKELGNIILLKKSNLALAFAFSLTMFSIAGIPPMSGFIAKFSVFLSIISTSFYFLAFIIVLFSIISTFYYIRIVKVIYFETVLVGNLYYPIKDNSTLILSILIFLLIFLFINPTFLYLLTYKAIQFTFYIYY
jgi:NADH:ubiquinone oxidoreductase subunit 2 (subunit N)